MIKEIKIKDIATFDDKGIEVKNCKKVNFIYGGNGSGKTTISRFLYEQDNLKFPECSVQWDNEGPLDVLVYNADFRERNFATGDIPGVFTLGEATKEELLLIKEKRNKINELLMFIGQKEETISKQEKHNQTLVSKFTETIWIEIYKKNEEVFKEAFKGSMSKSKFMKKLLSVYSFNSNTNPERENLTKRARIIFGDTPFHMELLPGIKNLGLTKVEDNMIWKKIILGKQDVNIAKLIQSLNNGDWVNEGRKFLENNDVCPFCQKKTITDKFRAEIEEYFSGEYKENINHIEELQRQYNLLTEKMTSLFIDIESKEKSNQKTKLNQERFSQNLSTLLSVLNTNKILISQKIKEPSTKINLEMSGNLIEKLLTDIQEANNEITKHNKIVKNYKNERQELISNIWTLLVNENREFIKKFKQKDLGLLRGIDELKKQLENKKKDLRKIKEEIIKDTKNITSVQPSVNIINDILMSYGFKGFQIVQSEKKNYYQIKREDGTLANDTLSEGEVTFITFLYYLQLVEGGTSVDNVTDSRVIVVDDPISSLDSNILFLVSSLLKKIIKSTKKNENNIKQIFVFTHNVYFHKEVSYMNGRTSKDKDTNYWILKKSSNISSIKSYEMNNPISTSYGLLWRELKDNTKSSSITIQNTMRRIIETYFNILCGYNNDDLIDKCPVQDREICRSLICWINEGSHCIPDDLYIELNNDTTERYYKVFKSIFVFTDHEKHYEMMMNSTS